MPYKITKTDKNEMKQAASLKQIRTSLIKLDYNLDCQIATLETQIS